MSEGISTPAYEECKLHLHVPIKGIQTEITASISLRGLTYNHGVIIKRALNDQKHRVLDHSKYSRQGQGCSKKNSKVLKWKPE